MSDDKTTGNEHKSPKKSNKPQMEKKRRERINNSLDELKLLILGAMKKDASYYSKLEKADILEMAVDHVRNLQKQIRTVQSPEADPMAKYRAGFITCASEVTRMVMGFPGLDESVKFNVMKHLANCCTGDQRHMVADTNIKQEVNHESIICQNTRTEPIRNQETKIEPIGSDNTRLEPIRSQDTRLESHRGQDTRLESIRGQDTRLESIRGQDLRMESLVSQERPKTIAGISHCNASEPKTVGEKRLMYQQLLSRAGAARRASSPEARLPQSQLSVNLFEHRGEDQKLQQANPNAKNTRKKYPTILPWDNNNNISKITTSVTVNGSINGSIPWADTITVDSNSENSNVGFKAMQKGRKSDGTLIKPVPQLPDKFLISGGIRLMPATVLVPVQVGYTPLGGYRDKNEAEKSNDVWRPWERMEQLTATSKAMHGTSIFSL